MLDPPEPSLHLLKLEWPRHMYVRSCEAVTEHSELAASGKLDVPWWQVKVSVAFLVEVCSVIIPSSKQVKRVRIAPVGLITCLVQPFGLEFSS